VLRTAVGAANPGAVQSGYFTPQRTDLNAAIPGISAIPYSAKAEMVANYLVP